MKQQRSQCPRRDTTWLTMWFLLFTSVLGAPVACYAHSGRLIMEYAPIVHYLDISRTNCSPSRLSPMVARLPAKHKQWIAGVRVLDPAIVYGAYACVQWLIRHGYDEAITNPDLGHDSAIDAAGVSDHCSARMIRLLVRHGANPHSTLALWNAAFQGAYGCVHLLLQLGASPNPVNPHVPPPITGAVAYSDNVGHLGRVLPLLLRWGADPNPWSLLPPLFLAVAPATRHPGWPCAPCVRLLLERGADPNAIDRRGQTALLWGLRPGYVTTMAVMRMLVRKGANVNLADPKTGETPLMAAAALGNREVVDYLLRQGAERCVRDNRGWTAADYARAAHHESMATELACH